MHSEDESLIRLNNRMPGPLLLIEFERRCMGHK